MDHVEISEIVCGLVLLKAIPLDSVDRTQLYPPYDKILAYFSEGKEIGDITALTSYRAVNAALTAGQSASKTTSVIDYLDILNETSSRVHIGTQLEKIAGRLLKGEPVDFTKVAGLLSQMEDGIQDFVTLDLVEADKFPWMLSYYEPYDTFVGGYPKAGLTIIGAPPGTGKTWLVSSMIAAAIRHSKRVAFYSLELTRGIVRARMDALDSHFTKEELALVLLSDSAYDIDEVYASIGKICSKYPDLYAIFIDFADLLIPTEVEESVTMAGKIYRLLALAAKKTGVPIILLSQLNSNYIGGVPQVNHIRWSRLAEAVASLILLIYNPSQIFVDQGQNKKAPVLEPIPGYGYHIVGKARYGFKMSGIGAIRIPWRGETGWGMLSSSCDWFPINNF